jgi:hypothetical protein
VTDAAALNVERWAMLSDVELEALARSVGAWLASHVRRMEFIGVRRFETPSVTEEDRELDDAHRTLVWHDPEWQLQWVLVPGGEIAPGYDERQLRRLKKRVAEMSGMGETEVDLAQDVLPYGSRAGWDPARLIARPLNRVEPLLVSAQPLLQSTPQIGHFIGPERVRIFKWTPGVHTVLAFLVDELGPVLATLGSRLPSDVEMQWLMAGGRRSLFPWGDRLPRYMWADEFWLADDAEEVFHRNFRAQFRYRYASAEPEWERANRFGLIDALVASTWCTIDGRPGYVGGAGECFPWQGAGEWADFLCAAAVTHVADSDQFLGHGLRPVISLASFGEYDSVTA